MSLLTIRWMLSKDIETVVSVEQDEVSNSWSIGRFQGEIENPSGRYIVLDVAGTVSAFGGLWLGVDEVHVVTMAVRANARRRGYGAVILRALLAIAKALGTSSATLECRVSNDAARELYGKFGFIIVGERPAYYSNGENALIMTTEEFDSPSFARRMKGIDAGLDLRFPGLGVMPSGDPR